MKKAIHNITISYWLKISFISLIIVIHLLSHEVFAGQFYRCTDAGGIETYTDQLLHANCKPLSMYGNTQISKGATVSTSPLLSELFQSSDNEVSNPDIINVVKTPIIGTGIDRFYTLLRKLQNGELTQVTIFHVGDSHVRSEAFSRKVAAVLQLQFGSLGGTFCFPANKKALASKTPVTSHKTPPPNKSNRNIPPSQAYLNWSRNILGGREPLGASTSTDSQRAHESVVSGDKPERASLTEPDTCNPITSLPGSLNGTGLSYYSYGNSGKTFAWYLTQPGFIQHLQWYRPDLVIVTLGTNDAFKKLSHIAALKDVDAFVSIIRSVLPNSSILFTTPPDSYFSNGVNNSYIATMRKVIIEYAGNHDLSVWDFYSAMGGEGSMNHWLNIGLAKPDRIHLTAKGYNLKGEMLSTALLDGYAHYLKKQGSK